MISGRGCRSNNFQKIVELNSIVKARESKLIDLSKKNAELAANNSEMKR